MTEKNKEIIAYKGFDKNWKCRGYQYEIGKTYEHEGKVEACKSGFHSCEYPLDVFSYYAPSESKFALVKAGGEISKCNDDSKIASTKITIEAELNIPKLAKKAVDFIMGKINWANTDKRSAATNTGNQSAATNTGDWSAATNTGDWSAVTNTGNQSAATNTGNQSAATNTGDWSAATNTGNQSAATNTGYQSAATNTGNRSAATNTGNQSAATNTGYQSAATNTGYQSAATNTGNRSAATNTGNRSAATNTGDWSAATNTGNRSAATNTGNRSAAEVSGEHSIAASLGGKSKARAGVNGAIVCVYRNDDGELIHIRASKVGENGINPDTWYTLNEDGEFIEVNDERD